jgi:hypothetical protein
MSLSKFSKPFSQYFDRYAEAEVGLLADNTNCLPETFIVEHVVVVPAYQESVEFLQRFITSPLANSPALMILVINQPENEPLNEQQQILFDFSLSCGELCWQHKNLFLVKVAGTPSWLLVVDRFTQGINPEQGVGLARKIGTDLASFLIAIGTIKQPWLFSTDADAYLPDSYFEAVKSLKSPSVAACFNFSHCCEEPVIHAANALYEKALRYYVAGLSYANSPYAFFTIGSVLVFSADAYVKVRGFPKRSAGEDFYLLNKLAKLGDVAFFKDNVIGLQARLSARVPFGTGPAVQKIVDLQESGESYCYYHPEVFQQLKCLLSEFSTLWQEREHVQQWLTTLPQAGQDAINSLNILAFINKQKGCNQQQFDKQLVVWFDAFKTLKFIHHLREHDYPDMPLEQGVMQADFEVE